MTGDRADRVSYSWLEKCMIMFGVAENMQKVLGNSMKKWKTTNSWRTKIRNSENKKRQVLGR